MTRNEIREQAVLDYMKANKSTDRWWRLFELEGWDGWYGTGSHGVRANGFFLNRSAIKSALRRLVEKGLVVEAPLPTNGHNIGSMWRVVEP